MILPFVLIVAYNGLMKNDKIIYRVLVVFVLITVLTNAGAFFIRDNIATQEKLKAKYTVQSTIGRIETQFDKYIDKAQYLKKCVESGMDVDNELFNSIASKMYDNSAIKAIELAPDGIVQDIYPIKENEAAYGINMLTDHVRKWAANSAKDSGKCTLEGPYDLKQGGKGALLFDPIYQGDEFWGFAILVVDWNTFLDEINLDALESASYNFEIWKTDRSTKSKIVIASSSKEVNGDALTLKCDVPNNQWNFEIVPQNGWVNRIEMIGLSVAGLLLDIFVTVGYAEFEIRHKREMEYTKEIEEVAQKAQEANEAKSRFLFSMSHDIRTPMNAIIGYTTLLENNPEKQKEYVAKIRSSSSFLLDLINQILEMARIESGKASLNLEVSCVDELVDSLNSIFESTAKEKGLMYTWVCDVKHKYVLCDRIKMEEIFLNVLGNSFKYTNAGSVSLHIQEVDCDKDGYAKYICTIQDTGIGMSEDYLPHAFEDFTRERTGAQTSVKGTGLGLPIVKSLINMMDGTIDIQSKVSKGTKTTMCFTLKLANEKDMQECKVQNKEEKLLDLQGIRVLLAEDNDLNAEIAMSLLQEYGIDVDHVTDGVACVSQLQKEKRAYYDCVLMDIQMPNMDGYQATQEIRKFSSIPIIAMTANAFEEDKQKALEVGMDAHIAKPIDIHVVVSTISKVLHPNKFVCPVCHKYVFKDGVGTYEICPVCGWENDKLQYEDPNLKGGANKLSLKEYRKQYEETCK